VLYSTGAIALICLLANAFFRRVEPYFAESI
jgi:hypothetical protein